MGVWDTASYDALKYYFYEGAIREKVYRSLLVKKALAVAPDTNFARWAGISQHDSDSDYGLSVPDRELTIAEWEHFLEDRGPPYRAGAHPPVHDGWGDWKPGVGVPHPDFPAMCPYPDLTR